MRTVVGFVLAVCGCGALPQHEVLCSQTDRCESGSSGNGASFVLGQANDQTNYWATGLNNPYAVALTSDQKLIVADRGHDRILIWNTIPTQSGAKPDVVLGQASLFVGPRANQPFNRTTDTPVVSRLAVSGTQLVANVESNNQLVFWNGIPTSNNAAYAFAFDGGTGVSASTFDRAAPLLAGGRMYASDRGNSRVLIWSSVPTASGANAGGQVGQLNFNVGMANAGGLSQSSLNQPEGSPGSDGTKLAVPDTQNHRVMVWNALPTMKNDAPDIALGQGSFTANSANRGGAIGLGTLSSPVGAALSAGRLAVADRGNHRVLLWNQTPTATGQLADLVLGQPSAGDGGVNTGGVSAGSMNTPQAVATDGTHVVVADSGNHRVLLWNAWPTSSGAAASVVLGQASPTSSAPRGAVAGRTRFVAPTGVARGGDRLIVTDHDANRVLIYSPLPAGADAQPQTVVGQAGFDSMVANDGGVRAASLSAPRAAASDGSVLVVADAGNNRVLVYRTIPTANGQAADVVLGQTSMTTSGANSGGAGAGLSNPMGVAVSGGRLYVADTGNHRVLIWNSIPMTSGQAADVVLGQGDLTGTSANRGQAAPRADSLRSPSAVLVDADSLYVSDAGNSRVLRWNSAVPASGQGADGVLGQTSLTVGSTPAGATTSSLSSPQGLAAMAGVLYVADSAFHRVLRFAAPPTQNGAAAISVIGQPSLTIGTPNSGGLTGDRLYGPNAVVRTEAWVYIADTDNSRVVALPAP